MYVRVSTERQVDGVSLQLQEELCRKRAKELGYSDDNLDLFHEDGYSGEDIDIRPEMTRLRELTSEKVYDHVICYHPDRFSRDMTDKLIVCREFEKHGVELVFSDVEYENSPEGKLFFNIMSAIAEYEHGLIKKRTISGRVGRVKNHKEIMPMRIAPFGFDWKDKQLTINDEEAKYVRLIYEWYVYDKLTLREIGNRLVNYGVKPKRKESSSWSATSISRILTSEIYIGKYYYNRRKTKKVRGEVTKSGNPKKTYDLRDKEDWLLVEVPSVVDEDMWSLAQNQRGKNKTNSGNAKHQYLLKSLLFCENCGRRWDGTSYSGSRRKDGTKSIYLIYRCPNKNPKKYGKEQDYCGCKNNTVRADVLEKFIWEEIVLDVINNPEKLAKKLEAANNGSEDEIVNNIKSLKANIEKKLEEKNRIKKMFQLGVIEEDEMFKDMKGVNNEIENIEYDISLLESKQKAKLSSKRKNDILIKLSQKYLEEIKSKDEIDFDTKRNIVTSYIDEIHISIDKNGRVRTDVRGEIQALIDSDSNIVSSTHHLYNVSNKS